MTINVSDNSRLRSTLMQGQQSGQARKNALCLSSPIAKCFHCKRNARSSECLAPSIISCMLPCLSSQGCGSFIDAGLIQGDRGKRRGNSDVKGSWLSPIIHQPAHQQVVCNCVFPRVLYQPQFIQISGHNGKSQQ